MPRRYGGVIAAVLPDGVGAEVGLEPGDILLSINGHPLCDVLDYRFYGAEEELDMIVERAGERHRIEIERDYDEDLGIEFSEPLFDQLRLCNNHCPFCFVQQMPKGLRRSLYLHDDDYRTSFLSGSFVTLTNLTETDWRRIVEQHLSPLYVSIHATDLAARRAVLGNPNAPDIVEQLRRLGQMGIQVHGQIVISPGVNDGEVLRRSIEGISALWPTVRTLALVPVGLTRYHRGGVRLLRPNEAANILDLADEYIANLRPRLGCSWLYPADELFLLAERPIPSSDFYDDDAQMENGVGLVRVLLDDWQAAKSLWRPMLGGLSRITLVCGASIAPTLRDIAAELHALAGVNVQVMSVDNRFFGESVTVSGLLTGQDVLATLAGHDLGEHVFLPRAMFDAEAALTLDDLSLAELAQRLGAPMSLAATMSDVLAVCASH